MPKFRTDAPSARGERSKTATDSPRLTASQAFARPTIPAPMTAVSNRCITVGGNAPAVQAFHWVAVPFRVRKPVDGKSGAAGLLLSVHRHPTRVQSYRQSPGGSNGQPAHARVVSR